MKVRAIAIVVAVLSSPLVARADDAADARAEYAAGTAALQHQAFREAAEHFDVAARLRPHAAAYFAAGKAWQLAGENVRSADRYSEALEHGELGPADRLDANRRLAELEQKLGTVQVSGDPAMQAQIDDGPPVHPIGARHALPGAHTLFLRGPNGSSKQDVSLAAGGSLPVDLKPDLVAASPVVVEPRPARLPDATPPSRDAGDKPAPAATPTTRIVGGVLLGGAGVATAISIGLGAAALSAKSDFLKSRTQADFDSATHLQTATNVGWVAAGLLGAAGAGLVIVSIVSKPDARSASFEIGPSRASFVGRF